MTLFCAYRIEAELEQQMEISSQAQKKQSNLVNRLQVREQTPPCVVIFNY